MAPRPALNELLLSALPRPLMVPTRQIVGHWLPHDPAAPKTTILHADAGYQSLLLALRPFDTEPMDHLGACQVTLHGFENEAEHAADALRASDAATAAARLCLVYLV